MPAATPTASLGLTPDGHLISTDPGSPLHHHFAISAMAGLVALGGKPAKPGADAPSLFWKRLADRFLRDLCQFPEGADAPPTLPPPDPATLAAWTLDAPPMRGAEYLSPDVLRSIWDQLARWAAREIAAAGSVAAFLTTHAPAWSQVGRVTLHLAENKGDEDFPFAFMATYASGISQAGRLSQLPLGRALQEYGAARDKPALLKLLTPLHAAAGSCPLMADLLNSGDVFHPLAWTPQEAYAFLRAIPVYQDAGLVARLPNWWKKRGPRPQVTATIGQKKSAALGRDALLDFRLEVTVDGTALSRAQVEEILAGDDGLVLFRGQWIEVDRDRLKEALAQWESIDAAGGISFVEGMRLLAGAAPDLADATGQEEGRDWAFARPGKGLEAMLSRLASPSPAPPPLGLRATLRPYQAQGLDWLWFCASAGLGACLADDMGLGKTIQVLAALLRRQQATPRSSPALLVIPASLIGNWKREAAQFAPSLKLHLAHRSEGDTIRPSPDSLAATDLVITTYSMASRLTWLADVRWGWLILDEAQAIKNPSARQTRAIKRLQADARIALTGTPVENHLGDLWSLFDFINPGLLGTSAQFKAFIRRLQADDAAHYAPLRRLVAPYILRRLKTDKSIIADLPEKTEMKVFCGLSPSQARLYAQAANSLEGELSSASGIARRGLVLAYLMRFKQICNHPDQLTGAGVYAPAESAKFSRLATLCEELASRGEKALIFTQFKELTAPLEACLSPIFGRAGLVLHGGTPVARRQQMVEQFQQDLGPPFFVLSLKAGGTGLNLTAASHVIHFDRWWNPAVENQATDRAFRIGQRRNVLVHKFITSGTLEERIDALIEEKQGAAEAILSGGPERSLTEMDDKELLSFIQLDLARAENS